MTTTQMPTTAKLSVALMRKFTRTAGQVIIRPQHNWGLNSREHNYSMHADGKKRRLRDSRSEREKN